MAIGTPSFSTQQFRTAEGSTLVNMPASVPAGDFLFIWGRVNNSPLVTLPAGWTSVVSFSRTGNTAAPNLFFAYKIAAGTEGGTTVSVTHSNNISTWISGTVSGVDTTTPIDATPITGDTGATNNSSSLSGYTTTVAGCLGFFLASQTGTAATSTPPTAPATWTERADNTAGSNVGTLCTLAGLSSGSQGTVANTWSGSLQHIEAMFALRPASTTTPITLPAETGTGADDLSVAGTVPLADVGAGADTVTTSATVPLADVGSTADGVTVAAAVPLADTGHGTDTIATTATVPLADVGSGVDAVNVTTTVPLADVGAGGDQVVVSATITLADVGTAADAISINTGSTPVTLPADTGAAVDGITVTVTDPLPPETGTALDALTVAAAVPLPADTGHWTDALTLQATAPLPDVATGLDALTTAATIPLPADTGHGTDQLAVTAVPALPPETGTAADAVIVTATITLADLAHAAETFSVQVLLNLTDTATGVDAITTNAPTPPSGFPYRTGAPFTTWQTGEPTGRPPTGPAWTGQQQRTPWQTGRPTARSPV